MSRSGKTFFILWFIAVYLFSPFLGPLGWCANIIDDLLNPPSPLTEEARATLGTVGLAKGFYLPEVELNTFAKNKSGGVAKGAAEGFLEAVSRMGNCSGSFCSVALLLWAATAGTAGAAYGAIQGYMDALPAEEAEKIEQSIEELSASIKLQERMSDHFQQMAQKKTTKKLVAIEGYGPTAPGEKTNYASLKNLPIDSVLEISVAKFGFRTWPKELKPMNGIVIGGKDPSVALFLDARPRLMRLSDNKTIYQPRLEVMSKFLKRSEWEADNFKRFPDEIERLIGTIVDKVSDDIFLTYVLPEETVP